MMPSVRFDHLVSLTTPWGLYEHALLDQPRPEHGFCLDDVARALVVTARQPGGDPVVEELTSVYLRFVLASLHDDGSAHNRRHDDGTWADEAGTDDHWGRGLWALGTASCDAADPVVRADALEGARIALRARSRWPRAMAYAALGAAEVLRSFPDDRAAQRMLIDARPLLGKPRVEPSWPWPELALTYANAVVPEAMIAIGAGLDDAALVHDGLGLLTWLVDQQTDGDHLSVVPVAGRRQGDARRGFDQQPIEVAALAEACSRAFDVTRDPTWAHVVDRCVAWFQGANDVGAVLYDPSTGGGYDGLERDGVNLNQGAESTLAALSTLQLGSRVGAGASR
jgi:hypothetical protein